MTLLVLLAGLSNDPNGGLGGPATPGTTLVMAKKTEPPLGSPKVKSSAWEYEDKPLAVALEGKRKHTGEIVGEVGNKGVLRADT